jgi:hypothetical protein
MNGYLAFYKGKKKEVYAATSYEAQTLAAKLFKVKEKKQHEVTVVLCEKDGKQVIHKPNF